MKPRPRLVPLAICAALLASCATTLRYEPTDGLAKLLAPTRPVAVTPFEDRRSDAVPGSPTRIGDAWGGRGATAFLVPFFVPVHIDQPWPRQWTDALVQGFVARGAQAAFVPESDVAAIPADTLIVTGVVQEFSVNQRPFTPVKAHVKATVRIYEATSKVVMVERVIEARHEQRAGLYKEIGAMNHAIRKAVEQVTTDPAVVAVMVRK